MWDKEYLDKKIIEKRIQLLQIILFIIFLFFIFSFFSIQILNHNYYVDKANNNKLQIQEILAPRGIIYDRNGKILADNKPSFNLILNRSLTKKTKDSILYLSKLMKKEKADMLDKIAQYEFYRYNYSFPILNNLDIKEVSLIEARKYIHPEFSIQIIPKRYYPFGEVSAHIVGYVGEATKEQIEANPKLFNRGQIIGQYGIEAYYDNYIRGQDGEEYNIVNSTGIKVGEIPTMRKEPQPGKSIILTIDYEIQEKVASLYKDKNGAAVVLQPSTGELLALWSSPAFDPNHFIPKISKEKWNEYIKDENFPLLNKTIQGRYSPGSVFKLVIALAALSEKKISPETKFFCPGFVNIYGNTFHCWKPAGHGWQNLKEAITHSCNVYFFNVARLLNIDTIAKYAKLLGLGKPTMIDMKNEISGNIPTSKWKLEILKKPWYPGETISIAVGQGPVVTTPLQMANLISFFANNGKIYKPHILKGIIDKDHIIYKRPEILAEPKIDPLIIKNIREALWSVVNENGTGARAKIQGLDICGKTGTVELITNKELLKKKELKEKFKEHSWFVGFAPKDNPQIAVAIFVEHGGFGGETAAPMAKEIFNKWYEIMNRNKKSL